MPTFNYFNYFTEIEEHFWQKRGAHLLVSPLDWAIVETWQKAGIPLDAVRAGIDRAFESYSRSRRGTTGRSLKSLAYCVDAVLEAAEDLREANAGIGPLAGRFREVEPFPREELGQHLDKGAAKLRTACLKQPTSELVSKFQECAQALDDMHRLLDPFARLDLEEVERRLTVLEDKLTAALVSSANVEKMVGVRREMERALAPYRRKMTSEQLALVERQYIQKFLFEAHGLSRLSLYYLK
jgi:hypothetical protein